ncbi:MAG: hypothetical protein PF487_05825 [Bacteroidales bacterium]|jgi:hypothetical protein|nr:hypothetical protein [Bacteroidales bacterium]
MIEKIKAIRILKLNVMQISAITFIIGFLVYNFWRLPYGLDTIFDEGFLLMNYQNPNIQGGTQSFSIISKIFGNTVHNILFLRESRYFLQLFTILIFSGVSILWITNKFSNISRNRLGTYFLLLLLFGIGSIDVLYTSTISYNHLQQTCILLSIAALLLFDISRKVWLQYVWVFSIGFFLLFAFLNIPPSGLVVGIIVVLTLFFYKKRSLLQYMSIILFLFLGIVVALCIYHFYFVNIYAVIHEMIITAKTSTKINDGHNIHNFIIKIVSYVKFYLFRIVLFTTLCLLFYYFKKNKLVMVLSCILLLCILYFETGYYLLIYPLVIAASFLLYSKIKKGIDLHFQTNTMIFIISIVTLVLATYAIVTNSIEFPIWGYIIFPISILYGVHYVLKKQIIIKSHFFILVALCILPLCSTLGTNTSLLTKSIYFLLFWGLILIYLLEFIYRKYEVSFLNASIIISILIITFSFMQNFKTLSLKDTIGNEFSSTKKCENLDAIKNIYIRPQQKQYFETVNNILIKYKYKKGDPVFAFQADHMTLFAFEASSATKIYFFCVNFAADPVKQIYSTPNFLFLSKWDVQELHDTLKNMNWGFPEDFDKYYVGTPEIYKTNYSTERWLYCRKSLKAIENDTL